MSTSPARFMRFSGGTLILGLGLAWFTPGPPANSQEFRLGPPGGPGGNFRGPMFPGMLPRSPLFDALDANHDGKISKDELSNASKSLKALDRNKDGELTREEIAPRPPLGRGPAREDGPPNPPRGRDRGEDREEGPPATRGRDRGEDREEGPPPPPRGRARREDREEGPPPRPRGRRERRDDGDSDITPRD